jgi:hypothetical protein
MGCWGTGSPHAWWLPTPISSHALRVRLLAVALASLVSAFQQGV